MAQGRPRQKAQDDFRCQGADLGHRRAKVGAGGPDPGNWGWGRQMQSDESRREGKRCRGYRDGMQSQQARWVHERRDMGVGRHQAQGMRKNVLRTVVVHGRHRADVNPVFAHIFVKCPQMNP